MNKSLKERLADFAKGSENYSRMGVGKKFSPPKKGGKPKLIETENAPGGPGTPGAKKAKKK